MKIKKHIFLDKDSGPGGGEGDGTEGTETSTFTKEEFEKLKSENTSLKETDDKSKRTIQNYKTMEQQRNQLESTLKNVQKSLKENNVGNLSIDDGQAILELNRINHNVNQPNQDETANEIDKLKTSYKEGTIDDDEYYERITDLKMNKLNKDMKKEIELQYNQQRQKDLNAAQENRKESINNTYTEKLNREFPGSEDQTSEIFKQMQEIYNRDPNRWQNIDEYESNGTKIKNYSPSNRLNLAYLAKAELELKGIDIKNTEKTKRETISDNFTDLQSGAFTYEPNDEKTNTEEVRRILVKGGITKDLMSRLDKQEFGKKLGNVPIGKYVM